MSEHTIVKFKLDPKKLPELTDEQRNRLKAIAQLPDSAIDYSDIPLQAGNVQWTKPGELVPEGNKQQVTLRLDPDVLRFFKNTGKRYQSRINAALRDYMNAHRKIA